MGTNDFLLIPAAFITSFISGIAGMGGGTLLILIMSSFFPFSVLIPAHGVIQAGSNASRILVNRKYLDMKIGRLYLVGASIGVLIGFFIKIPLEARTLGPLLGVFILMTTWFRLHQFIFISHYSVLGTLSTVLSLFVGVAGPLVHPFILKEKHLSKLGFIATESFCAGSTHLLKILIFSLWGVSLSGYWRILILMLPMTFLGAYFGKLVVKKIPERNYRNFVKVFISLMAIRLIYNSLN